MHKTETLSAHDAVLELNHVDDVDEKEPVMPRAPWAAESKNVDAVDEHDADDEPCTGADGVWYMPVQNSKWSLPKMLWLGG